MSDLRPVMSALESTTANTLVAAIVSGDGNRDPALAEAWEAYSRWDAAAIARKRRLDLSRIVIFVLLVAAALTGVLASQLTLTWFAGIAAACSAAAALLGREAVGPAVERLWLTARAAAETLKSEAFKYAAGASLMPRSASVIVPGVAGVRLRPAANTIVSG